MTEETMRFRGTGSHRDGKLLHRFSGMEDDNSGNGSIGHGRNRYGGLVHIPFIEEARLCQRHLHRQRNQHLALADRIFHRLVVRIHAHIEGRELVGGTETEIQRPIGPRIKMRLESKGRCKIGTHANVGIRGIEARGVAQDSAVRLNTFLHQHIGLVGRHGGHGNALGHALHAHKMVSARPLDTAADTAQGHIIHRILPHVHLRPVVGGDGIYALVPGRRQHFHARLRLQAEGVFHPRIGLVVETGELQRQGKFVLHAAIFPLKAHGISVLEIEHHEPYGIRIAVQVRELDGDQTALFHHQSLRSQHAAAFPEEGGHGINAADTGAQAGLNALGRGDGQFSGQEDMLHFRAHEILPRHNAENPVFPVAANSDAVFPGYAHLGFQKV